jgi:hypothetical protein
MHACACVCACACAWKREHCMASSGRVTHSPPPNKPEMARLAPFSDAFTAATAEKTSAAPFPRASKVIPASESDIPRHLATVLMLGTIRASTTSTRLTNKNPIHTTIAANLKRQVGWWVYEFADGLFPLDPTNQRRVTR